ncbi:hypothetical protein ACOSQ2_013095 [Xanthoceras sorbifolium]|uniref:Non-specific lipid-transfer protein n=1 Tax=Xanthoceras sorbifolium TaxID=99658 RepID=A0ABQ8HYJ9_9ROSI|nr:hypothetical protein JRO89_XS06G0155100 [Xanthoceras sorbifolium]
MEKKTMMGSSVLLALAAVVVMAVMSANCVQAAVTCADALTTIMPCKPFLVDGADKPSVPCCIGVKKVKDMASNPADRREICECFKKAAPGMGVDPAKAEALPGLCGVQFPFPIKPDIDCNKIGY